MLSSSPPRRVDRSDGLTATPADRLTRPAARPDGGPGSRQPAGRSDRDPGWSSVRSSPTGLVPPRVRRRARALLWRHRFWVAAVLLGLAAAAVVHRLSPPPEPVRAVVVAASTLPAGATLAAADLQTVSIPLDAVADGWPDDPGAVVGRTLALTVTEGTVLAPPLLVDTTSTGPPGTVVAGVRLAEPALASVLFPGMHVDLLAASATVDGGVGADASVGADGAEATPATTLAVRALVLPRPGPADEGAGVLGAVGGGGSGDELLLVAVAPAEASLLANVAGRQAVSAVVVQ